MEIFADIDNYTKLVKITVNELAIIQGFDSQYDDKFNTKSISVGSVVDVLLYHKTSKYVKTLNTSILRKIKSDLDSASATLDKSVILIEEIENFNILKGTHEKNCSK